MVLEIKTPEDKHEFLMDQVHEFLEVVEGVNPNEFSEAYKNILIKFFDRMIKEYNMRKHSSKICRCGAVLSEGPRNEFRCGSCGCILYKNKEDK